MQIGKVIILIVEDNRHMRRLLIEIVRPAFAASTVLEAADARTATRLCRETRPALTAEIKSLFPTTRVVIVSGYRWPEWQYAAAAAGAAAYVLKDDVLDKLLPALAQVLEQ
jgi:DNA-binding NarL/FixJ family response regulator